MPPEHPDSPASTFAPRQPGAVVGDDVPEGERQGKPTVSEATAADAKRLERERADAAKAEKAERGRLAGEVEQAARDREYAAERHPTTSVSK